MKKLLLLIVLCVLFPSAVFADTHTAADCEEESINTAIAASEAGDTVYILPGECTWTTPVTIDKAIYLKGSGTASTIITDSTPSSGGTTSGGLQITATSGTVEVSHFKIQNTTRRCIFISGAATFKIHDMYFHASNAAAKMFGIWAGGTGYGVIYNNYFWNTKVDNDLESGSSDYDARWTIATALGGADFVFVEGNTFYRTKTGSSNGETTQNVIDLNDGGRVVFRYNTAYNGHIYNHAPGYARRAPRAYEYYNNAMVLNSDGNVWVWGLFEGGTGIIYNMRIWGSHAFSNDLPIQDQRACTNPGPVSPWTGDCATCTDGQCETYDGLPGVNGGYPCKGQIGYGVDTGIATANAQEPIFQWNMATCTSGTYPTCSGTSTVDFYLRNNCANMANILQVNRDFYNATSLANAQALGFSATYTPYQCPHPLAGSGSCDSSKYGTDGYTLSATPPSATGCTIQGGTFK